MVTLSTGSELGGVVVGVDAFGSFGSDIANSAGAVGDAVLTTPDGTVGTTDVSALAIQLNGTGERIVLSTGNIGGAGGAIDPGFIGATDNASRLESSFIVRDTAGNDVLDVDLSQTLSTVVVDGTAVGARLNQTYQFAVAAGASGPVDFDVVRYFDGNFTDVDGNAFGGGGITIDASNSGGDRLFLSGIANEPTVTTPAVEIGSSGETPTPANSRFAIDAADVLLPSLIAGDALDNTVANTGLDVDGDDDFFIDSGQDFDAALALRDLVPALQEGSFTTYATETFFRFDAPIPLVANDDSAITAGEQAVTIAVLDNDSGFALNPLNVESVDIAEANGTVEIGPDNTLTYTANAGFAGNDSFTYTVGDGAATATATVSVLVLGGPSAVADSFETAQNDSLPIAAGELLANDTNPAGGLLEIVAFQAETTAGGTVTRDDSGTPDDASDDTFTYTPALNFGSPVAATDTFTYTVETVLENGFVAQSTGTVSIGVNPSIIAADDAVVGTQGQTLAIDVLANDGNPGNEIVAIVDTFADLVTAQGGTVTLDNGGTPDDASDDSLTYVPATGFFGSDSFEYTITNDSGDLSVGTVDITVEPAIDTTADLGLTVGTGQVLIVDVLNNDDGEGLTIADFETETALGGAIARDPNNANRLVYIAPAELPEGAATTDSFTYTATDGTNVSAETTVEIEVFPFPADTFAVDPDVTAETLVNTLLGPGVTVSNIQLTGASGASGTFIGGQAAGLEIEAGVILSSGNITNALPPNNEDGAGNDLGEPGDLTLDEILNEANGDDADEATQDATVLEFDIVSEESELSFNYIFASEEYNEFVNAGFNDIFAFSLIDADGNSENIALVPGSETPVSIDNVNNDTNSGFFIDNDFGDLDPVPFPIEYDGFTTELTATATVTPGETQTLRLAIADVGDGILDSAVFIGAGSLGSPIIITPVLAVETSGLNETLRLDPDPDELFPQGTSRLEFTLESVNAAAVSEIGTYTVEDADGSISVGSTTISPGSENYQTSALAQADARVLFSGLFENPVGDLDFASRVLEFSTNDRLGFYVVVNDTTDAVQFGDAAAGSAVFFSFAGPNSDSDRQQITDNGDGSFSVGLDIDSNGSFDDLVFRVAPTEADPIVGAALQGGDPQRDIIDLRGHGPQRAAISVAGEADFSNTFGFYQIADVSGRVLDEVTGDLLSPGDTGYAIAALREAVIVADAGGVTRGGGSSDTFGGLLAPFLIANGSLEDFNLNTGAPAPTATLPLDPRAFFNYFDANPTAGPGGSEVGLDRVRLFGDNTFGFEDLPGGGDLDYNDAIIEVNFADA